MKRSPWKGAWRVGSGYLARKFAGENVFKPYYSLHQASKSGYGTICPIEGFKEFERVVSEKPSKANIARALSLVDDLKDAVDARCDNLLFPVIEYNNIDVLDVLLEKYDLDPNHRNKLHDAPIHYAVYHSEKIDFAAIVKRLIKHGADLELENDRHETPLTLAVSIEKIDAIGPLMRMGAKCDKFSGVSPFRAAIENNSGDFPALKELLINGLDPKEVRKHIESEYTMFSRCQSELVKWTKAAELAHNYYAKDSTSETKALKVVEDMGKHTREIFVGIVGRILDNLGEQKIEEYITPTSFSVDGKLIELPGNSGYLVYDDRASQSLEGKIKSVERALKMLAPPKDPNPPLDFESTYCQELLAAGELPYIDDGIDD